MELRLLLGDEGDILLSFGEVTPNITPNKSSPAKEGFSATIDRHSSNPKAEIVTRPRSSTLDGVSSSIKPSSS
jgi:hypothetical protein